MHQGLIEGVVKTAKCQPVEPENLPTVSEILVSKLPVQLTSTPDSNWNDYMSPIFLLEKKTDQTL